MKPDPSPLRSPVPTEVDPLIDPRALAFLSRTLGPKHRHSEIAGDASTRRFYRVRSGRRSVVLIAHPDPLEPSSPFYSNHRILKAIGAPVPRLVGRSNASGLVLVEDFGDTTLQKHLLPVAGRGRGRATRVRPEADYRALYRQACDLIVLMQQRAARAIRPRDFAATNALDQERFLFELDHFRRHFILGLRRLRPDRLEEAMLGDFFAALSGECDRMPRVYCHRDFQSRNLMVRGGRLFLIDFQDARMGPYTYDAASLLRDSSLDLPEGLVSEMIAYLSDRLGEGLEEFRKDFDLMALQRNIKDLGTFAYMATVRGRPDYLEYVPRTLRSVRRTLLHDPRFDIYFPALQRLLLRAA